MGRSTLALTLTLATLASVGAAQANGRFPSAGYVIAGPGRSNDRVALRTTFGLVVSSDAGRSWTWVCEQSYEAGDGWDPTLAIGERGDLFVSLTDGITGSSDLCTFTRAAGIGTPLVADLAQSPDGRVLLGVYGGFGSPTGVLRSTDGGRTWTRGASRATGTFETVDMAPSDPNRVYLGGFTAEGNPLLFRSDDGGVTVREVHRMFTTFDALVSGVSAANPDVVYVRANTLSGTSLLRSDDGGTTLREITSTQGMMKGFALSDDGATVWIGSETSEEGLRRSVRGGAFQRVGAPLSVRCLRQNAGVLFVCGEERLAGWSLACSTDGGERLTPLLAFRSLPGPAACPSSSRGGMFCPAAWTPTRMLFSMFDAGVAPPPPGGGHPDAASAFEASTSDRADAGALDRTAPGDLGAMDLGAMDLGAMDLGFDSGSDTVTPADVTDSGTPSLDASPRDTGFASVDTPAPDAAVRPGNGDSCGCSTPGRRAKSDGLGLATLALALVTRSARKRPCLPSRGTIP